MRLLNYVNREAQIRPANSPLSAVCPTWPLSWKYSQITSATILDDRKILRKFAEKESLVFPTLGKKLNLPLGFQNKKGENNNWN